ncbi:hypothetical protein [Nannocystis sp. SCPEA4]|nr:hypothetical protein [Nannocystis sp. SCPEA4]MCY1060381.1 hypothetical protein [Nannocystis sp. SCPEA4]
MNTKGEQNNFKVVGELRKLRKLAQREGSPKTIFTGSCQNTGTCCVVDPP